MTGRAAGEQQQAITVGSRSWPWREFYAAGVVCHFPPWPDGAYRAQWRQFPGRTILSLRGWWRGALTGPVPPIRDAAMRQLNAAAGCSTAAAMDRRLPFLVRI